MPSNSIVGPHTESYFTATMSWFSIGLGALFAGFSGWELWRGLWALQWPVAPGRMLEIGARKHRARGTRYTPTVRYTYKVGQQMLEGTRLDFGVQLLSGSAEGAQAELEPLVPGAEVIVRYNPRRPTDAVLRPGTD